MKCARLDGMVEGEAHSSGLNLKDHVAAVKSLRCEGRATEYDVVDRRSIEHNANLEKSRSVVIWLRPFEVWLYGPIKATNIDVVQ